MIVFKTFLKILNKCKVPILMYTVFLVIFSIFGMQANDVSSTFEAVKPDIAIVNEDKNGKTAKNLVEYLRENGVEKSFENEDEIKDALFYRNVSYVIYIPESFSENFMKGENPEVRVKSAGNYESSLASMLVERYMKVADAYRLLMSDEEEMCNAIEKTLESKVEVEVTSKLDTNSLERASRYYNFTNYCLLAGAIFIICLVMAIFREEKIDKRTRVSSTDYKSFNRQLLACNALFSVSLWAIYVLISFFIAKEAMFSLHGILYIANSFVFSLCSLSLAFLLGSVVRNKEAVNGIVNVIALGSSFLCGAFVPMEFLPNSVLNIAHILPSYWFIKSNELIKSLEIVTLNSTAPIFINMSIVIAFAIVFFIATNVLGRRSSKKN